MEIWVALVGGVILGWLLEWVIDWLYWRRGVEAFYATEAELRRELAVAQTALAEAAAENERLRGRLGAQS